MSKDIEYEVDRLLVKVEAAKKTAHLPVPRRFFTMSPEELHPILLAAQSAIKHARECSEREEFLVTLNHTPREEAGCVCDTCNVIRTIEG
jgi:hypothetical protein